MAEERRSELKEANAMVARVSELQRTHFLNKKEMLRSLWGDVEEHSTHLAWPLPNNSSPPARDNTLDTTVESEEAAH